MWVNYITALYGCSKKELTLGATTLAFSALNIFRPLGIPGTNYFQTEHLCNMDTRHLTGYSDDKRAKKEKLTGLDGTKTAVLMLC